MNNNNKLADWFNTHPREAWQIVTLFICAVWQLPLLLLSLLAFLLFSRLLQLPWWGVLSAGIGIAIITLLIQYAEYGTDFSLYSWLIGGFYLQMDFWRSVQQGNIGDGILLFFQQGLSYLFGLPVLIGGILATLDLIPNAAHEEALKALHRGEKGYTPEVSEKQLKTALARLPDDDPVGTLLGISKYTGKPVIVPDQNINQILLILGTTGGGKTITLRRFYRHAAKQHHPMVLVDGKPTKETEEWLMRLAEEFDRPFYGFNCEPYHHYDCLAQGGYTELKDKIISLKDEWESDYYRSIAEDYLQTTFEVLIKNKQPFELKTVVDCLDYESLAVLVRQIDDEQLTARVRRLEQYERKDITGLQAHLNLLIHSELGEFFKKNETTFSLPQAIQEDAIVYFALPNSLKMLNYQARNPRA